MYNLKGKVAVITGSGRHKGIGEAIAIVTGAGKIFGTVAATAEQAKELTDKGVTLLLNSVQGLMTPAVKAFMKDRIS